MRAASLAFTQHRGELAAFGLAQFCAVGRDLVDGVGFCGARVYDDVAGELSVEECFDAEVEVGLR